MASLPVGETLRFSSHDSESGRLRSIPENLKAIAVGDRVLGYQKSVGVVARLVLVDTERATIGPADSMNPVSQIPGTIHTCWTVAVIKRPLL